MLRTGEVVAQSTLIVNTVRAVGSYLNRANKQRPLIEQWDGSRWAIVPSPVPAAATG